MSSTKRTCDQLGVCQCIACPECADATAQQIAIDRELAEQMQPMSWFEEVGFWAAIVVVSVAVISVIYGLVGLLVGGLTA